MPKDNTLGAPTEGLGQTVTFAAGGSQGTPQMAAEQRQALRNQQQGGFAIQPKQAQFIPDRTGDSTFQLLAKLGGEILKPHIEQERTAAYVRGMQRAAQGEAITELVDEQPAFSRLFGSTSLVDGARAYTASAKATSIATSLESDMTKLRELGPDEFAKVATERMLTANTGDATTDMIIQQQMAQSLPGVMKAQAKEHLKFKTDQLNTSMSASIDAQFAQIGAADAASRDPQSVRDRLRPLELQASVVQTLVPPADMDKAHYDKLLAHSVTKAVWGGNFAVLNMLENSGRLAAMSGEQQAEIQKAAYRARIEARAGLPLEFAVKQAEWEDMPHSADGNTEAITKGAEALNAEYTRLTGDTHPYLNTSTVARNVQERARLERAAVAERVAAIEKANKPDKQVLKDAEEALGAFSALESKDVVYIDTYDKKARNAGFKMFSDKNPERATLAMVQQYGASGLMWDDKASAMRAEVSDSIRTVNPQKLAAVYQKFYLPMVKLSGDLDTAVADAYMGPHKDLMRRYHEQSLANQRGGGVLSEDGLYQSAVPEPVKEAKMTKGSAGVAILKMVKGGDSMIPRAFREDYVDSVNPQGDTNVLSQFWDSRLPEDAAYKEARRVAERNGYNFVAGHTWKTPPVDATSLKGYLSSRAGAAIKDGSKNLVAANEVNRATDYTIQQVAKSMNMESVSAVTQLKDANGIPRFYISGPLPDGSSIIGIMSGKDIEDNWHNRDKIEAQASAKAAVPAATSVSKAKSPEQFARERKAQQMK